MKILQKFYEYSISSNLLIRSIFWIIIVGINSTIGFMFGLQYNLYGKILGIITWILLYIFLFSKFSSKNYSELFNKSLSFSYFLRTFLVILFILLSFIYEFFNISLHNYFYISFPFQFSVGIDFMVGVFSLGVIGKIFEIIGVTLEPNNLFYTYFTTLLHGFILSLIVFLFGCIVYLITKYRLNYLNKNKISHEK